MKQKETKQFNKNDKFCKHQTILFNKTCYFFLLFTGGHKDEILKKCYSVEMKLLKLYYNKKEPDVLNVIFNAIGQKKMIFLLAEKQYIQSVILSRYWMNLQIERKINVMNNTHS